jgi:anti-sigma B factor antagonist
VFLLDVVIYNGLGEKMDIDFKLEKGIGIIKITGRLVVSNAREFKENFDSFIDQSRFLVLDLTDMDYIDSLGLGSLINFYKTVTENDGDLYIAGLQSKPKTLFHITKAYLIFNIFDDLNEAVESLAQKIQYAVGKN